ncbi:MAG: HAMP domain-containing protein [Verrucomicrobiota bacterium]|nr:HAMP domain-containing protein [Verrucomicrobiota bacterium]
MLALVFLVTVISRRFTHPLKGLTQTAAAIEAGKFREEMLGDLPEHRDEVGELARSFRKMAREIQGREQSLAELNQNLERTVAQRTAELTARVKARCSISAPIITRWGSRSATSPSRSSMAAIPPPWSSPISCLNA